MNEILYARLFIIDMYFKGTKRTKIQSRSPALEIDLNPTKSIIKIVY